ncbi:protein PROCA1 [Zonotrichia leucophrys gambelii]|uniref:protein PROCA1 n=1 Tax=Zonotrichia leucophrys gambelii TaxID=257770 RepID=UPI003140B5AA
MPGASFSRRGPLRAGGCAGRARHGAGVCGRLVTGPGTSPHRLPQQRGRSHGRAEPFPAGRAAGAAAAPRLCGTLRAVPGRAKPCRAAPRGRAALLYKAAPRRRAARCHVRPGAALPPPPPPPPLLPPAAACPGAAQPGRPRARRGLTYPGTLWCGAGSNADSYEQLGEHRDTDRCCREHDHCQHVIHPFTARYGYRNLRWHTISHCDCDLRLKQCLRRVNDTASRAVGQAFFNVIQVPCFEFTYREECVEPYLYVWCRAYNTVAVAVPREPVLYEFGGELIDRAARPRGVPLSPPWDHHELPGDHHTGTAPKAGKKERKRKKDKKNKGKGLKKKGSSEKRVRSHPAGPADPWALLPSSNTILSDAPAREGAGREPVPATPSPVPTTSGKRRRKERNRKKRLKSKTEAEPA